MSIIAELTNGQNVVVGKLEDLDKLLEESTVKSLQNFDQSFDTAFFKVEQFLNTNVIPTIALGVYDLDDPNAGTQGTLRAGFFNAWERNKQLNIRDAFSSFWEMRFNTQRFIDSVFKKATGAQYGLFHVKEFSGRSRYFKPSTPATKPIPLNEIWNAAINMLSDEFIAQMQFRGYKFT